SRVLRLYGSRASGRRLHVRRDRRAERRAGGHPSDGRHADLGDRRPDHPRAGHGGPAWSLGRDQLDFRGLAAAALPGRRFHRARPADRIGDRRTLRAAPGGGGRRARHAAEDRVQSQTGARSESVVSERSSMSYVFTPAERPSVEVEGRAERFPVHRIYCVGRNYAAHAREMGKDPDREPPFFFTKPADAIVANRTVIPYPPRTKNFHHEIELVVAIGLAGRDIPTAGALDHVFGYAVGIDLTRRDLQLEARDKGRPWDTGKAFDRSAVITAIRPASACGH